MSTIEAPPIQEHSTTESAPTPSNAPPLRECVQHAVEKYFAHLDGQPTSDLYNMVISEVEEPLLQTVMKHTNGNQSKAAELLGLSRGTLRKKLDIYGMLV